MGNQLFVHCLKGNLFIWMIFKQVMFIIRIASVMQQSPKVVQFYHFYMLWMILSKIVRLAMLSR